MRVEIKHEFPAFSLDVAFEASPGVTALFGPSGSGKTSVIRAIAGLLACNFVRVSLAGQEMSALPVHKRGIGYVFQDTRLFPHLDVLQNLRFGGCVDEDRVVDVLGLGHLLNRRPVTLSGGEAQRVALGRALMSGPRALLMDEPLSALDGGRKAEVLPYLEALRDNSNIPILYVSHDMSEVGRLANALVVLNRGKVVLAGSVEDVLADPAAVPYIGVREAGAVVSGRVSAHFEDGLSEIETDLGKLYVPGDAVAVGTALRLRIPAQDIILARSRPENVSALNVVAATVTHVKPGAGPGVAIGLQAGEGRLVARITKKSALALRLNAGDQVFAMLKATAIAPADIGYR